jgi:T5SS/PEP-CTERM-associated repeat protein
VSNYGYLDGTVQSGVFLTGGTVTNAAAGRIAGVSGVVIRGAAGTVINLGSIGANSLAGYSVYFASGFANRLVASPGARFTGVANGGNAPGATAVSTLELAAGSQPGTLSGLGTQFINFGQTTIDAGASWSLTGTGSIVAGATLSNQGNLELSGALVANGTVTGAGAVTIASAASIIASVTVTGGGSWTGGAALVSGDAGTGSVLVSNNGTFGAATAVFGASAGGTGGLDVAGMGARFSTSGLLTLGSAGRGSLVVENQGTVLSGGTAAADTGLDVAAMAGGAGGVTVTGTKSLLSNAGRFVVGDAGLGSLLVESGGTVVTTPGTVAGLAGLVIANTAGAARSSVSVSGTGSRVTVTGLLDVGVNGSGALSLSGGATATAGSLDAGNVAAAVGQISLSGTGTALIIANGATVADDGAGVLSVLSGATFAAASLTVGSQGDSSGALVVSGSGSLVQLSGALNIGTSLGTGDLIVGPGAAVHASVVNLQGQVVLEGGLLDPTVQVINQGQTAGGYGTIAAGDIVDEGVIQDGGTKPSQKLLIVQGTVLGGGTLTVDGTLPGSVPAGVLQINAGGTMELTGAVLNATTTTFTDELTPTDTYTVNNSVIDVTFADAAGVLQLDDIAQFAGTITTYQAGDSFVITGGTLSALNGSNGNTLTVSDSGSGAGAGGIDQIIFGSAISAAGFNVVNGNTVQVACFAAGTRIETVDGPMAVEALAVGDRVVTRDGACEPIVWIGQRAVNCERHPKPETVWPVRVRAGAFGENVPTRDLYLSPDHAVFVNGVLVPVKLLVNGTSIVQVRRPSVTYYHVELPRHAVILAEGSPVESYLDTGDRSDFGQDGVIRLHPDFGARLRRDAAMLWETRGVAPLVMTGPRLETARAGVAASAPRYGSSSMGQTSQGG